MMRPADLLIQRRDQVLARRKQAGRGRSGQRPVEIVARRSEYAKTFRIGHHSHLSQAAGPVHYDPGDGSWQEIDTAFEPSEQAGVYAEMTRASFEATVFADRIGWRHESRRGGWMQVELVAVDGSPVGEIPTPQLRDGHVWWDQVAPGVDLQLVAYPLRSEMFKHLDAAHELTWRISSGGGFDGQFQEAVRGWNRHGERLEIATSRDGDRFTERWTGRVSQVIDPHTRRRAWRQHRGGDGLVTVDAAVSEGITVDVDDGSELRVTAGGSPYGGDWSSADPVWVVGGGPVTPALTYHWNAGVRFRNLAIPNGAFILSAALTVNVTDIYGTPPWGRIYGVAEDDAPVWVPYSVVPTLVNKTPSYVQWTPVATGMQSVDVLGPVAEVLGRGGWASGNNLALALIGILGTASVHDDVHVEDYYAGTANPAQLDVSFSEDVFVGDGGVVVGGAAAVGPHVGTGGVVISGAAAVQTDLATGRHDSPAQRFPDRPELDLMPWVGQRQGTFRFLLYDGINGIRKGELHPVRDSVPVLTHDTSRIITRQVTLQLDQEATELVNTVRDRVEIEMLLGGEVYPLGSYMFVNNPREVISAGKRESTPALMDQMWSIDQQLDLGFATISPEPVEAALRRLLIPFGFMLDIEPSVFSTTGAWAPGSRRGQVVEQLALAGDWFPPWFDNRSRLRFIRSFDPGARIPDFDFDAFPVVLRGSIAEVDDLLEAPNRWVVVGNMASNGTQLKTPVVGVYDLPDEAPHSAANRGFTIPEVVELPVGSGQQAAAVARNLGQQQTLYEQVELSTLPDPRHDGFNVIRWDGQLWLEISWAMQLVEGGEMQHTLRRAYVGELGELT